MTDPNGIWSENENNNEANPTSNRPEQIPIDTGQATPNRASVPARRTISTQTDPDMRVHGTDQRGNQRNGRRISMHDPGRFLLGLARPSDGVLTLNQPQHGNNGIMHPTDEMWRMGTIDIVPTCTNVHPLHIGESTAVEDPRPHDLLPRDISNSIRFETTTNDEDDYPRVDRDTNTDSMGPTTTNDPAEYPHDVEFSEVTLESDSDHELDTETELNDRRVHANYLAVDDSSMTNEDEASRNPGDVTAVNNEMVNTSTETNITIDQPNPTAIPQVSCSEASVSRPNVPTSTGCVNEAARCIAPPLNPLSPIVPGVIESGDESN